MASSKQTPSAFLSNLPAKKRNLAKSLQKTLMKINSNYEQTCAWKGLAFKLGSNYSCMIVPYSDHLKLMIWRGAMLADPEERLHGKGLNTRHILIRNERDINPPYLKTLLKQQFKLYASGIPFEEPCETRKSRPMPTFVKEALTEHKLMDAFKKRPPYQKRDYIYWITEAKREATKESRLHQMLDELAAGNVFMKMPWEKKKD